MEGEGVKEGEEKGEGTGRRGNGIWREFASLALGEIDARDQHHRHAKD